LSALEKAVHEGLVKLQQQDFARRLWERDPSLWKAEPEHQRIIENALGWLSVPELMLGQVDSLLQFVEEVRAEGYRHAVVLGMGGSSLCPDVCRATFGTAPGYLDLQVLDSTVPASVAQIEKSIDLQKTLFLVSSKSGGTVEPLSFFAYFFHLIEKAKGERAGENFVAVTDPGTALEKMAREKVFRRVFHGQPDIGGRYSALSNFGMVPAALEGADVRELLGRAAGMAQACAASVPLEENPAVALGVLLAEAARSGRDKLTFVMSPGIYTFADWVEQLLAESTGKEGKGLVPVVREFINAPESYGNDRLFIHMSLISEMNRTVQKRLETLEAAGHPVVRFELADPYDLGKEFFRWEVATATAGALLGINPFDQPNVQESKDNTNRLLGQYRDQGRLAEDVPVAEYEGVKILCPPALYARFQEKLQVRDGMTPAELVASFLGEGNPRSYVALLPYLEFSSGHKAAIQVLRLVIRDGLRLATTVGYGPRYLHSTGQLHKGGAASGLFVLITADDRQDLPVPGQPYTFSILKQAQALGDYQALASKGRPVLRFHLGTAIQVGLDNLAGLTRAALSKLQNIGG
jgi:transaldolase/glucose-6-phosphate isomerase